MIVGSAQCSDTIGDRVMKTQQLNNDDNSFSNPPSEEEAQCIPVVSSSHSINVSSNHTAASQHGGSSRLSTSKESSGTSHSSSQSSYFLVSSPYLYHFLVLVLLTFAQSAGKPHQKLLLYYNLWNTARVLVNPTSPIGTHIFNERKASCFKWGMLAGQRQLLWQGTNLSYLIHDSSNSLNAYFLALFDKDSLVTLLSKPLVEHTFSIQCIDFLLSGSM